MSKIIKFIPASTEADIKLSAPAPARSHVPEWYRKATRFIGGSMQLNPAGINKDLKLCVPFLDALTSGYCLELPCDVLVQRDERGVTMFWHEEPIPVTTRSKQIASTLPRPSGHDQDLYAWVGHWGIITPPGYSTVVMHPLNRFDLPFTTTSGIMDTDTYSAAGEIPFFLKEGFEGTIPAGTPIAQLFPYKRESWKSEKLPYDQKYVKGTLYKVQRYLYGGYKKFLWQKKDYS